MGSVLLAVLVLVGGVAFLAMLTGPIQRWRVWRQRVLWEDALKQICSAEQEGRSLTCAELGGRLERRPRSILGLAKELEGAGLLRCHEGVLELTEAGRRLGMRVLRGHRLWERYLADEAQLSLDRLHAPAERAEHQLREDDLEALADHLGRPRSDPHGDLIPSATGVTPRSACR
jgi:DtxR family Mn-dependent transcriptional regulator